MTTPGVGPEVLHIVPVTLDEAERDATLLHEAIDRSWEVAKHLARTPFAGRTSLPAQTHPVACVSTPRRCTRAVSTPHPRRFEWESTVDARSRRAG